MTPIRNIWLTIAMVALVAGLTSPRASAQDSSTGMATEFHAAKAAKKEAGAKRTPAAKSHAAKSSPSSRGHASKVNKPARVTRQAHTKQPAVRNNARVKTQVQSHPRTPVVTHKGNIPAGVNRNVRSPNATGRRLSKGPGATQHRLTRGPGVRSTTLARAPGRYWKGWRQPARVVVIRDRRRFWANNGWRTWVPFATLGAFAVGATMFYPDGYVSMPGPVCSGVTGDGCQLRWQDVAVEEGGSEFQCVQFCPQRNRTIGEVSLPETVGAVEGPAETQGASSQAQAPERAGCELTIYADANFRGTSAPTDADQSNLDAEGWKNQVASVEIKSGTWDFFTGDDYSGEMMRLGAGSYATLDAKWSRHIGSFMCSKPAGS